MSSALFSPITLRGAEFHNRLRSVLRCGCLTEQQDAMPRVVIGRELLREPHFPLRASVLDVALRYAPQPHHCAPITRSSARD